MAAETFNLEELGKTLESWRRIAWMCTDPDRYRRMWRRAAELYTREDIADDEALPVTKARLELLNALYTVETDEQSDQQIADAPQTQRFPGRPLAQRPDPAGVRSASAATGRDEW